MDNKIKQSNTHVAAAPANAEYSSSRRHRPRVTNNKEVELNKVKQIIEESKLDDNSTKRQFQLSHRIGLIGQIYEYGYSPKLEKAYKDEIAYLNKFKKVTEKNIIAKELNSLIKQYKTLSKTVLSKRKVKVV